MNVEASIFKAYDIRGLYPSQLTAEVARRVGRAFVDYLGAKRIVVGHDARLSSPELSAAFIRGARSQGASVVDIGRVGTDMMYYYSAKHGLDGGAIITASHNPKEWNGIKMVRQGAYALSGDAGIKEIKEAVVGGRYADDPPPRAPEAARVSVIDDYARHCLSFIDKAKVRPLRAVLDTGNGMGAVGAAALFPSLPVETIRMYFDLDGTFPNHPPDPLEAANRREIEERVVAEKADLGLAWDGDADRCFFVDDEGGFVPGDFVTALLGEAFVRKFPGASIVYVKNPALSGFFRMNRAGRVGSVGKWGAEIACDCDHHPFRIQYPSGARAQQELGIAGNRPAAVKAAHLSHASNSGKTDSDDPGLEPPRGELIGGCRHCGHRCDQRQNECDDPEAHLVAAGRQVGEQVVTRLTFTVRPRYLEAQEPAAAVVQLHAHAVHAAARLLYTLLNAVTRQTRHVQPHQVAYRIQGRRRDLGIRDRTTNIGAGRHRDCKATRPIGTHGCTVQRASEASGRPSAAWVRLT
jgi:hypothetical protein